MASLDIQPGISDQMIEFFKLKVKTMSVQELLSLLSADEVSLKIWFDVNPQRDLVEGYEDYGKYGRTKKSGCSKKNQICSHVSGTATLRI